MKTKFFVSFSVCVAMFVLGYAMCGHNQDRVEVEGTEVAKVIIIDNLVFDDLLDAIEQEESRGNANAVCPSYCCVGAFQITKGYVDHVNEILRGNSRWASDVQYTYEDRRDRAKSRSMTETYIDFLSKKQINLDPQLLSYCSLLVWFEMAARIHKGGPDGWEEADTIPYWERIKKRLECDGKRFG